MFTGIVEEIGVIQDMQVRGSSGSILIRAKRVLQGTQVGDSIAVNGICLTVTRLFHEGFTADVMAETMRRSSLSVCHPGDRVNLERAMAAWLQMADSAGISLAVISMVLAGFSPSAGKRMRSGSPFRPRLRF